MADDPDKVRSQDQSLDRRAQEPVTREFTRAELMQMATSPPWLGSVPYASFEVEQIV